MNTGQQRILSLSVSLSSALSITSFISFIETLELLFIRRFHSLAVTDGNGLTAGKQRGTKTQQIFHKAASTLGLRWTVNDPNKVISSAPSQSLSNSGWPSVQVAISRGVDLNPICHRFIISTVGMK